MRAVGCFQQRTYHLGQWVEKSTGHRHLVTRELARALRDAIEREFFYAPPQSLIRLDCRELDVIDFTGADELFVKMVRRLLMDEYGSVYLLLTGASNSQRHIIDVALTRARLSLLVQQDDGAASVIGDLDPYLREAFAHVDEAGRLTARDLVEIEDISISDASTILLRLYQRRLIHRDAEVYKPSGGRYYVYTRIRENPHGA